MSLHLVPFEINQRLNHSKRRKCSRPMNQRHHLPLVRTSLYFQYDFLALYSKMCICEIRSFFWASVDDTAHFEWFESNMLLFFKFYEGKLPILWIASGLLNKNALFSFLLFIYFLRLFWKSFNWLMDLFNRFKDSFKDSGIQEHAVTKLCDYPAHNSAS